MPKDIEGDLLGTGQKIGIVVSRFNDFITQRLRDGAVDCLVRHGVQDQDIEVVKVPGAFEIPMAAKKMVARNKYDAVICLGAVIRGETTHDQHINRAVTIAMSDIALEHEVPVMLGLLTCETLEQAIQRAGGNVGNKGTECAEAALHMLGLLRNLS